MFQQLLRSVRALALPRSVMVLLATLVFGSGLVGAHVLTASADPRMPVSIEPQAPSVQSGEFLTYNAFVGCSIPEGCTNATFTFTKPPAASGGGVVAKPYPPGVSSVTQLPNGDVQVVFDTITVGSTKQLTVSWPTADYYTIPGPQPVTMTGTSDTATSPSTASTTMDVTATSTLTMSKSAPANVAVDTNFSYAINVYNSGTSARGRLAIDATVTDVLPAGLEFVSANGGGTYDPATRTITWRLDSNGTIPGYQFAGTSNLVVTVRAPSNANPPLQGTTILNTAHVTGTPYGGGTELTATDDASTAVGTGPGTVVPGFDKIAASSVGDGQNLGYFLLVKNQGTAPGPAVVTDDLPLGFALQSVNYAISGTPIEVVYSDGTTGSFTYTGGQLKVAKAGVRVTRITLHVPSLAPGSSIQHTLVGIADRESLPAGSTSMQNCASSDMGGQVLSDCVTTTITEPQVSFGIMKTTSQEPVNPGGTHTWRVVLANNLAPISPQVIDLLPPELEYVPGSFAFSAVQTGPCPAVTDFTVTNPTNWNDGRDAVIITGNDGVRMGTGTRCDYTFQTQVKSGAPSGTYTKADQTNRIYLFDQLGQPFPNGTADASDINHDGITAKSLAASSDSFAVAESSAAEIVKQVKGDQDDAWLDSAEVPGQEDQIGTSDFGGTVDWRLSMGNQGNRNLTDLVAYDLLPDPASPGITDGRYDETKPYEWVPTMTGPIDADGAPVTITYSTKTDPCRPEMDATKGSASFWCDGNVDSSFRAAADVADWSKVKSIRFDFGDHVFPGGEYFSFQWKMDVPEVGPDGTTLENGAETWNKSAVQAARRNGDGSTLPLLPAEAPWVVDVIRIPPVPMIDIVKKDSAGNDANTADDAVEVPAGADTPLEFTITNTGTEPLVDVEVADEVTDGGAKVTGLSCDFSALGGPATGTTWAGPFLAGETFPCTADLGALTPGDDHADLATVTATGQESGTDVDDDDPYHATTTAEPGIGIIKEDAAGNDANSALSPVLAPADETTGLVFTITNDGTETLDDIEVSDEVTDGDATVTDLSCDFSGLGGPATGTTWDGPFEVGDSFECTATLSALTPGDLHADLATVTGVGHYTGTEVDDDDPYHALTPTPDVQIVKQDAAGNDADTADDAVDAIPGVETELELTITNDGTEPLVDVEVSDEVTAGDATVTDLTCDFSALGGPATGTTWDGPFAVGTSFECTATLSALTPGIDHTDVATVTGTGRFSGTEVDDDDPYHAQTTPEPGVTIVKEDADGNDANTADDAVEVPKGADTDLVFTVTNSGIEPLEDIAVSDEITAGSGTVSGLNCDFSGLGGPATGTTWDGPFAVGKSFTCTATLTGLKPGELHTDIATVEGTGRYSGKPVDDDDPWNGETPPIYAIGDFMWFDQDRDGAQDGTEPAIEGATVTLTDADGNPVTDADGNVVAATTTDVNGRYHFDNLPAGDYVVTFTAPTGYEFTTVLSGSDPKVDSDAEPATGSSAVVHLGPDDPNLTESNERDGVVAPHIDRTIDAGVVVSGTPGITIVKGDAAGNEADTADDAVTVPNETTTDLVFTITNDGTEPLADIEVTDEVTEGEATVTGLTCDFSDLGGPATGTTWDGPFQVGDSFGCTAVLSALEPGASHTDVATVTGAGHYSGTPVDDDNPYHSDTPPLVSVGDYVWFDTDRDGVQDEGEAPVEGVTVNIYDADGELVGTTTTDEHGFYSFTDLRAATEYQIEFVAPDGTSFTTRDAGDDDAADSDADLETGKTAVFTTPASGSNSATTPDDPTWDAGLVQLDLTITKALVSDGPFLPGDTVEFELVPHNNGPVDALTGWSVTDVMPKGLTLVSIEGDGYECTLDTATCVDVTGERLAADADGGPITVTATIDEGVTGVLHNVTYVAPVDGDVPETNPLDVPDTTTDTSTTGTNNDDQADLTVDEVPVTPTTTTTQPTKVVEQTTVPSGDGSGTGTGTSTGTRTGSIVRTGADVARQVGLGAGLAVAGIVLVLAARRRRETQLA